jgi:uncharacterized membrane protein
MQVLLVYIILLCMLFIGSESYASSYTKADMDALSIIFFRPFFMIIVMAIIILYLLVNHFKNQRKSKRN